LKFVPHLDEHGHEDGYYLLTPQRDGWEDKWFIYVENGMYGNLSSWYGDPGPQGMWKVEPWNIGVGNQGAVQDQISNTLKELPAMPMLGSAASGYTGPQRRTDRPQILSEIRLEATFSEAVDLHSLPPHQRGVPFHVDKDTYFAQNVGRQHQEALFMQLIPNRETCASLSRSIFELTLEPPSSCPTIKKVSNNMVCVGGQNLRQGESTRVSNGTQIQLAGMDGQSPILVFTVYCTSRSSGAGASVDMTRAALNGGGGGLLGAIGGLFGGSDPSPTSQPRNYKAMETAGNGGYDQRPPTLPMYNEPGSPNGRGGAAQASLECTFSAASMHSRSSVIQLIPDQEVAIGRQHQCGFFEKLLPDQDHLACISRKHLTARLQRGGRMVEIENVSRNTVKIGSRTLSQGERGEVREGDTLTFTAREQPILSFRLNNEGGSPGGGGIIDGFRAATRFN